jgi:hypothetical protein
MLNNCLNPQSHDRKGVVTSIAHRVSRIEYQASKTCKSCRNPARNKNKIMQNKANSPSVQDDTSTLITKTYKIFSCFLSPKNKAKQSQFKPNFRPILASFFSNKANFKHNSVKMGNLRQHTLSRNLFRFYSVFCVLCPVSFFVPNYNYKLLAGERKELK